MEEIWNAIGVINNAIPACMRAEGCFATKAASLLGCVHFWRVNADTLRKR